MAFQFDAKPQIEICGKSYDFDITDCELIEGLATDFPMILMIAQEFQEMQERFRSKPDEGLRDAFLSKNTELLESCRAFLCKSLGTKCYDEIFSKRKPNSAEHVKLCAYLFEHISREREQIVTKYLDLPKEGKSRAAAKTANKAAGKAD